MATKKVKMQVSIAGHVDEKNGHANDFSYATGEEVELDAKLADKWAEVGHCVIVGEGSKPKTPKAKESAKDKTPDAPDGADGENKEQGDGTPEGGAQAQQPEAPPAAPAPAAPSKPAKPAKAKGDKAGKKNSAGK